MLIKRKNFAKVFSSFLAILLTLSLFNPMFVSAEKDQMMKKDDVASEKIAMLQDLVESQESLLQRKGEIHPNLQRMQRSADQEVSVIVQLSEAPVALEKGKSKLKSRLFTASQETNIKRKILSQQSNLEKQMHKLNIAFEKGYTYSRTINAIELKVKESDLEKIANIPGVVSIDPNEKMYALEDRSNETMGTHMDSSIDHLRVPEIWEGGNEGEGIKVGVIDSGIDYDHPDLVDVYQGGMNFVVHDEETYLNGRDANDPYETSPIDRPEHLPEFNELTQSYYYTSHGTHVAGTIAATGANEYGIKGVAPKVDIYAYRVLGAYGSGQTTWVIAGIEQAVEDGMDIINLSLGGGSNSENDPSSIAVNNATLEGVTVISATGNSGPGLGSIGTPATSPLGIAVGNSTLPETVHYAEVHVEAGNYSNDSTIAMMAWTFGTHPEEALSGEYDLVAIPGWGEPNDFEGIDVTGKVALISRGGEVPFVNKILAAIDAGAVATIIHNNDDDGPAGVYLGDSFDWIPSFDMSTVEGNALREALESNNGKVSFSNFSEDQTEGDHVYESSSRGPSTPNFDIKPDVVAPGTNIISTVPAYQKDFPEENYDQAFERFTGTSMAAPHVAGIAALLLAANADWEPYDVKVALSNTAKKLDTQYSVFEQGSGLVQPVEALETGVLAYVLDTTMSVDKEVDNPKGTVTFGRFAPDAEEEMTITKEIEVRSLNGQSGEFNVDIEETRTGTGASLSVDKSSFTLNGKETIEVTLTVEPGEDIPGNEFLGYINITGENTNLSLPYAVELSGYAPTGLEYYFIDDIAISPNGDGILDETKLNFSLYDDQENVIFELWSPVDPGPAEDGYIGYLDGGSIPAGAYYLPIDGKYIDWESGAEADIPDGIYTIDFNKLNMEEGYMETMAYAPLFVKRDAPKLTFDEVEEEIDHHQYEITGTIEDQFIDFKEIVEYAFDEDYDVNDYLSVTYELVNEAGDVVDEDTVALEQDGDFTLPLKNLTTGNYVFELTVVDIAGNLGQEELNLTVNYESEDFNVSLTPSTTDPTEDPVTISVETDSEEELVSVKWLEGKAEADDFAQEGEEIDLETMEFTVEQNNYYTVYVKNSHDVEAVETITVLNILDPEQGDIHVELDPSTDEPTENPVQIKVHSDDDLEVLKWLPGANSIKDFEPESESEVDENADEVSAKSEEATADAEEATTDGSEEVIADESENEATAGESEVGVTTDESENSVTANESESEGTSAGQEEAATGTESAEDESEEAGAANESGDEGTATESEEAEAAKATESEEEVTATESEADESEKVTAADSEEYGYVIDLETRTFEVTENGIYTVYGKTTDGERGVFLISVENIVDFEEPEEFNLTLSPSTTDETEDPVTVSIESDSEADLVSVKWLEGERTAEDFAEAGTEIDLDTMSFEVTENGTYTVYAVNSEGVFALETITINNIVVPEEPEEPEEPGEPQPDPEDPEDPQPQPDPEEPEDPEDDPGQPGDPQDPETPETPEQPEDPETPEQDSDDPDADGEEIPKTATPFYNYLAAGIILLSAGLLTLFIRHRRSLIA